MLTATTVGGILSIGNWTNAIVVEWLFLLGLGFFLQVYINKAFQTAATNQVAPLKYIEVIIFTLFFGVVWFGEL